MPQYRVTLKYPDGESRQTTVWADSPSDAREQVKRIARAQLKDRQWGGDRSKGMPRVSGGEKV